MIAACAMAALLASCGGTGETEKKVESEETVEHVEAKPVVASYAVNTAETTLGWKGSKSPEDAHNGGIAVSGGTIEIADNVITGGSFTIDMASITCKDLEGTEYAEKLVGHLMNQDFFLVDSFATSSFEITAVSDSNVTGNLIVLGVGKEVSFPVAVSVSEDKVEAKGTFGIDFTGFGVAGLGSTEEAHEHEEGEDHEEEETISPIIEFDLNLVANKK